MPGVAVLHQAEQTFATLGSVAARTVLACGMDLNMAVANWYRPIEGFVADYHWPILIVFLVAMLVAIGIRARRERNPTIRGPVLTGTARILSSKVSGGGEVACRIRVELRVEIPGRPPYDVTLTREFNLIDVPRVQPGATFPVQVDANNPHQVVINFSHSPT
jgi:hypothetical protein